MLNITKFIAACIALSLIGVPTVSFAKARGGSGGGFSSGSRSGGSGSMGSRGSRTYEQNGARPIERSTAAKPAGDDSTADGESSPDRPAFTCRAALLLAAARILSRGLAAGLAVPWIGHMIFGATDSSARTNEAGERTGEAEQPAGSSGPNGMMLILLMLMGGGVLYYFLKGRRSRFRTFPESREAPP